MDKILTHGSLFSGIGGFDLAAEWMGWENMFHCEWNEFGQRILNYYWPKAECYGDITKTDFTIWRGRIDVLSGGFPCQDASIAKQDGNGQQGLQGKRTGLFFEMVRAIEEIRPKYIIAENVANILKTNGGKTLQQYSPNYPDWGIMQNGEFVVRQKSVHPTTGQGCIWLLTPTASDYMRANLSFPMWERRKHRSAGSLSEQLYRLFGAVCGRVNHQFYAWMMGYPLNYTKKALKPTETQ